MSRLSRYLHSLFLLLASRKLREVSITGAVKDSSGAAISKAEVTIKNSQTQVARSIDTNEDGVYSAPNLVPSTYEITAHAPGFGTLVKSDITLSVGAQQVVDFELHPGSVDTRVEVSGTPPNIELGNSSLDATLNSTTVRELPLNGRDWTLLADTAARCYRS